VSVTVLKAITDELIHSSAMTVILMTEEPGSARVLQGDFPCLRL
jgi:hypothetical protein